MEATMNKVNIGVISMVMKDVIAAKGIYETLRQFSGLGYHYLEVSQLEMSPENIAELKRASDDFAIRIPVITAPLQGMGISIPGRSSYSLDTDFDRIVGDCNTLGSTIVRIGSLPPQFAVSAEKYAEFAGQCEEAAGKLSAHGIQLYYHNHNWEFARFGNLYGLDIIRENTDKLGFEIDVHWAWRGGVDPVKLIRRFAGRCDLIHLKDYRIAAPDPNLIKSGDMRAIFGALQNSTQFAELGEGSLDFKSIIDAALETGTKYFFIEQDDTYGRDPMESLRISADYLRKLGFGAML